MDKELKKKKLPIYRMIVSDDDSDNTKVDVVSLVTNPAIEKTWTAFNEDGTFKRFKFAVQDSVKHNLAGPFMVPEFPIYRKGDPASGMEECYVMFTSQDIENAIKKFSKGSFNNNITTQHGNNNAKAYVLESWQVMDPKKDKSLLFGPEMPVGTWYGIVHIEDQSYWDEFIMTGELTGYSVEGLFEIGNKIDEKEMSYEQNFESEKAISIDELTEIFMEMMKKNK